MNLSKRCNQVWKAIHESTSYSLRSLARTTALSKSSINRLKNRLMKRNIYPESPLWETEEGQQWLHRLVIASLFIFAIEGGIGCERLSHFFHLLRER